MSALRPTLTCARETASRPGWIEVPVGHADVAAFERPALGTTARVVIWPVEEVPAALAVVDVELASLDRQVSRFRPDSELRAAERRPGTPTVLTPGAAEALRVALEAARVTEGLVDPTVGRSLCALGYDRDFAAIVDDLPVPGIPEPAPGWRVVHLDGRVLRLPPGVRLDLGATAKGLGADRAARAAAASGPAGVLVDLGGDIAVAGTATAGGWPIAVAEEPTAIAPGGPIVRLRTGGIATSSVRHRRWHQSGQVRHHIVDPSTGAPSAGPWRTVTVAARSCVEANVASTAALVAGDGAERWLLERGLPARLVSESGSVRLVGGWPAGAHGVLRPPEWSIFDRSDPRRAG